MVRNAHQYNQALMGTAFPFPCVNYWRRVGMCLQFPYGRELIKTRIKLHLIHRPTVSEVFVRIKIEVFRAVTPYSLVGMYQRFGGIYCFYLRLNQAECCSDTVTGLPNPSISDNTERVFVFCLIRRPNVNWVGSSVCGKQTRVALYQDELGLSESRFCDEVLHKFSQLTRLHKNLKQRKTLP